MNTVLQSIRIALWTWRDVGSLLFRSPIWVPLLVIAGAQTAALVILAGFHSPVLFPIGAPLIKWLGGDQALHYPLLYYALPSVFFHLNLFITALIGSLAGGALALRFAQAYGFDDRTDAWRVALRHAPALIAAGMLVAAVYFGAARLGALLPREVLLHNSIARWSTRGGFIVLFILIDSLLAYVTAWIVLMGHRIGPALRDSVRVTVKTLAPTAIVVGVPALLFFPLSYAASRTDLIANHFRPELVVAVIGLKILVQLPLTFFLAGGITRLFVWRVEAAR